MTLPPPDHRRRVLLIDSDPRRRSVTATLLRLGGYSVAEVGRLADVPEAARGGVDALVTEAQLADGDGIAYSARLRANPAMAALPILIATVDHASAPTVASAIGPDAFLAMPTRPSELLERLARLTAST